MATMLTPAKGSMNDSISKSKMPMAQTSDGLLYGLPCTISGDMYVGVPQTVPCRTLSIGLVSARAADRMCVQSVL